MRKLAIAIALASLAAAPLTAAPRPGAQEFTILRPGDLLDFRFSFPTFAASSPELLAAIRHDERENRVRALSDAREDFSLSRENHLTFHRHEFWRDWTVEGQTNRLIVLKSHTDLFTGGAHPNHRTGLLLWDRQKRTSLQFSNLFTSPANFWDLFKSDYCAGLRAKRMRRAGISGVDCSSAKQLSFIPTDTDENWEIDTIRAIADPYVAGSYAEGTYSISLPVTRQLIAAMKPAYRSSFEAQRQ